MKAMDILKQELKKELPHLGEEVIEEIVDTATHKVLPRLALEADEAVVKGIATAALPVVAALQSVIDKATDLDKDGK